MGGPNPQDNPGSHTPNIRSRPPPATPSRHSTTGRGSWLDTPSPIDSNRLRPTSNYAPTGPNARQPAQH